MCLDKDLLLDSVAWRCLVIQFQMLDFVCERFAIFIVEFFFPFFAFYLPRYAMFSDEIY